MNSIGLRAGAADQIRPAPRFSLNKAGELRRATACHFKALRGELFRDVGFGQNSVQRRGQAAHRRRRSLRRGQNPLPGNHLKAREGGFGHARDIGQGLVTPATGNRERAQAPSASPIIIPLSLSYPPTG